jgi:hypothetical protein
MSTPLTQQIEDAAVYSKVVEGRGNGLLAQHDLAPRSQILFIARPLMLALETAKLSTHCYCCLDSPGDAFRLNPENPPLKLMVCGGCKVVKFCNKKCQSRAWDGYHRLECKLFARLHPRTLPTPVRAIVRLLKQHAAGLLPDGEWEQMLSLESHYRDLLDAGGDRWQDAFLMAKGVKGYCATDHSQELVLKIVCVVRRIAPASGAHLLIVLKLLVNSFTLTTPSFDSLGLALHPTSALMNHSCEPNAYVRFDVVPKAGKDLSVYGSISVHALRSLDKEEEITISYVDPMFPFAKRQEELRNRYHFECACRRCLQVSSAATDRLLSTSLSNGSAAPSLFTGAQAQSVGVRAESYLQSLQSKTAILHTQLLPIRQAMQSLAKSGVWPLQRYPWPQLRHELFLALLANETYYEALIQSAIFIRVIHPVVYPDENHPLRLMQIWTFINLGRTCLEQDVVKDDGVPPRDMSHRMPMLGLLGCIYVEYLWRNTHNCSTVDGLFEKAVDNAYNGLRAAGGVWAMYQHNPGEARKSACAWLDKQVTAQLKEAGVSQEIIDLALPTLE